MKLSVAVSCLLAVAAAFTVPGAKDPVPCPIQIGAATSCTSQVLGDGGCHCAVQVKKTWPDARMYCESYEMQLVSIETEEEMLAIRQIWLLSTTEKHWTSGSDDGHEGRWIWTSTGRAFNYTNWGPGQPDNHHDKQNYLVINYGTEHQWDDDNYDDQYYSFCEARP